MSATTDLQSFLRAKAGPGTSGGEPETDLQARKDAFCRQVKRLYGVVRKWLGPLEKEGVLRFHESKIKLAEDGTGAYNIGVLSILIGKQKVSFFPKGAMIVGAEGRVDIQGPKAMRTIILNEGQWSAVERTPRLAFAPFNEISFQAILNEVME